MTWGPGITTRGGRIARTRSASVTRSIARTIVRCFRSTSGGRASRGFYVNGFWVHKVGIYFIFQRLNWKTEGGGDEGAW